MPDHQMITVLQCSACGTLDAGPRDVCPKCYAPKLASISLSGRGALVSWTMIRRPPAAFREDGAYAVAVVVLDAGCQVTGRLFNPSEAIRPGARVNAVGRLRDVVLFDVET